MPRQIFGLFGNPHVHVLTDLVSDAAVASLSRREAAALANFSAKRMREFATARALAREGLGRFFGVCGFDLLNAEDRSPVWPRGIAGSISHSSTRAWVALVDAAFGTIGIDGECRGELKRDLWGLTLLEEEIAQIETFDVSVRGRHALAHFSAKEALFKAQYPRSGSFMDYMSLSVDLSDTGSLRCLFHQTIGPFPKGFVAHGRWMDGNELLTAVWIPSS